MFGHIYMILMYERVSNVMNIVNDYLEPPMTNKDEKTCQQCHGTGIDYRPVCYDDGSLSRTVEGWPCEACQRPPVAPLGEDEAVSALLTGYNEGKAHAVAFKHPQAALRHYLKYAYRALQPHLAIPQSQWRPISSAPRDGTIILVYDPEQIHDDGDSNIITGRIGTACRARYESEYWDAHDCREESTYYKPTHWQPLPLPPGKV